ncbi:occludin b [Pholidichthys leucotaenia]
MPRDKHSSPYGSREKYRHSEVMSNPVFTRYTGDKLLHYYRWTSPPGVMKILSIIIIIMCVAIFACVASTLAWDYDMSLIGGGAGGLLPGVGGSFGGNPFGGSFGGSFAGSNLGGIAGPGLGGSGSLSGVGFGGTQIDQKSGKGFIIAIAAITFIAVLIIFILVVSRQNAARSHKFYLAAIIICAILAFLMIIASIVYLVSVNPTAQTSGSIFYNQIRQLCAQFQTTTQAQAQGLFINQYLYHYCVVEPQEAIAIVLGFLAFVALIILVVFAAKTRSQIRRWGEDRILWEEVKIINSPHHNSVGEWVNNISGDPEVMLHDPNNKVGELRDSIDHLGYNKPLYLPGDSDVSSSVEGANPRLRVYDTGVESGDELEEEEDFTVLFPPIVDEHERLTYKQEFDRDLHDYKSLQAELDSINRDLADLERELEQHSEGSPQFLDALDDYNRLKNLKKSPDYQIKKRRCKYLRAKLSHIKKKISEYDRRP